MINFFHYLDAFEYAKQAEGPLSFIVSSEVNSERMTKWSYPEKSITEIMVLSTFCKD